MAKQPTQKQILDALFAKFELSMAVAFRESINDITDKAELGRIITALETGNIEAAIQAMHIDGAAYAPLVEQTTAAFAEGGRVAVAGFPPIKTPEGANLVIRFNIRNPRAERILAEQSGEFITRTVTDQKTAVRSALKTGLELGRNPRATALNVIGRIDMATKRRSGGIVGLSSPQEKFISTAMAELRSGNPKQLQNYLNRVRRDRRFDTLVHDSIASGKPIKSDIADKIAGRYSDRLLQTRGEAIARTETLSSINSAHQEAINQAIDTGGVRPQDVRKVWVTSHDSRVRSSHIQLDRDSVGTNDRFANGLRYPGDKSGRASEVMNCRCTLLTRIDFLSNLG